MIKLALKMLFAVFFVGAGVNHFLRTSFYLRMMPPYAPCHLAMVQLTGVAEIVLGILLLARPASPTAAWGLIVLLIAVFPACPDGAAPGDVSGVPAADPVAAAAAPGGADCVGVLVYGQKR